MQIVRDYRLCPAHLRGQVLAIGNFDGLHLGHRAVLREARTHAERLGAGLAVMTFEPHPRRFFTPSLPPLRLLSLSEKLRGLAEAGVATVFAQRFDAHFSQLDAGQFTDAVLAAALGVRHVVTGEEFVFGRGRGGHAATLRAAADTHGFGYSAVPPVLMDGAPCSSTRVREALKDGAMAQAARLLGRAYTVTGRVRHGDKLGRTIGYPTANFALSRRFLPRFGVYAVEVALGSETRTGVANLGIRPTVGGTAPQLETHLFNWSRDLYGQRMTVTLHRFLRPEQRFDGLDGLKAQIENDAEAAKHYFERHPA